MWVSYQSGLARFGGGDPQGGHAAMADASVRHVSTNIDPLMIYELSTRTAEAVGVSEPF